MRNLYLYLLCFICFAKASAQGENDNWYFGNKVGVNFSGSFPVSLSDSQMNQTEAVASISDANGNLLFYTNGNSIWNREHLIMENGTDLSGSSSTQQVIIVPYPGNSNLYYIFTMSQVWPTLSSFIAYSIVDINSGSIGINGLPLGSVLSGSKNVHLLDENGVDFTYKSEAVAYIPHQDNKGYWILIPNGLKLYSYKLDSTGFNPTPVTSTLTFGAPLNYHSEIAISPLLSEDLNLPFTNFVSVTKWLDGTNSGQLRVYSFDNSTGLLTNDYELAVNNSGPYSTEFNSDGTLLYTCHLINAPVSVYDLLLSPPVRRSLYTDTSNASNLYGGTLQRAVDEDIYMNFRGYNPDFTNISYLGKIENSNSASSSLVNLYSVSITGGKGYGLPPWIDVLPQNQCWPNLTLGAMETNDNYTHRASNSITTNSNYSVDTAIDIKLKAGGFIEMLPNTILNHGSNVLAIIESCTAEVYSRNAIKNNTPVKYVVNSDEEHNEELRIYPNPTSNIVNLSLTDSKINNISLNSIDGKPVLNKNVDAIYILQLDMSIYEKGIYIVTVRTDAGKVVTGKIMKN